MNNMNKILCAAIVLSIVTAAFSGCGKNDEQPNNTVSFSADYHDTEDTPESEDVSESVSETVSAEVSEKKTVKTILYVTGAEFVPFYSEIDGEYREIAQLTSGSEVELKDKDLSSEYVCVYYPQDEVEGYMQSIYLVTDKSAAANGETLTVSAESTELYSEEGGKGSVVKYLVLGEEVSVLAKTSGGYWRVKTADGLTGYVKVENITDSKSSDVDGTAVNSKGNVNSGGGSGGNVTENNQTVYITENTVVGGGSTENTERSTSSDSGYSTSSRISDNVQSDLPTVSSTQEVGSGSSLSNAVQNAQYSAGGNWAAALIELDSGRQQSVNDSPMQAASLIKLYIMGAIYEKYDTYIEQDSNIDTYLYSMITVSDNTAANNLVRILGSGNTDAGKTVVTAYCRSHGYGNSSMGRLLLESTINGDNYTSVGDCARFLTAVYNNELPHSAEMLSLLKQQTRTSKIPSGVPYGVQTANKTGELDLVQNDAAIVFADSPYVLCVMSENVSAGSAVSSIVTLSSDVYGMVNS